MVGTVIAVILIVWALWLALWITLWVKGTKSRNKPLTIISAFFALGLIGVIVAVVQVVSWNGEVTNEIMLQMEKEKLELEKEKFEFEKAKKEK